MRKSRSNRRSKKRSNRKLKGGAIVNRANYGHLCTSNNIDDEGNIEDIITMSEFDNQYLMVRNNTCYDARQLKDMIDRGDRRWPLTREDMNAQELREIQDRAAGRLEPPPPRHEAPVERAPSDARAVALARAASQAPPLLDHVFTDGANYDIRVYVTREYDIRNIYFDKHTSYVNSSNGLYRIVVMPSDEVERTGRGATEYKNLLEQLWGFPFKDYRIPHDVTALICGFVLYWNKLSFDYDAMQPQ